MDNTRRFLSVKDITSITGVSGRKIRDYLNRGVIKGIKISRDWLIYIEEYNRVFPEYRSTGNVEVLPKNLQQAPKQKIAHKKVVDNSIDVDDIDDSEEDAFLKKETVPPNIPVSKEEDDDDILFDDNNEDYDEDDLNRYANKLGKGKLGSKRLQFTRNYLEKHPDALDDDVTNAFKIALAREAGLLKKSFF